MAETTPAELEAVKVLIAHTRTRIEGCHCGWGMDGTKLGQSHALHVWRELQQAVLPDHDARVRAELGDAIADQIIEMDRHTDCTAADFAATARAIARTKEPT